MGGRNPTGMPRHYSRRMGRRNGARPVVKSYKKILNHLEAGYGAGFRSIECVVGVDNSTTGQTSITDGTVPTGSIIKYVEVQFSLTNVTAANIYVNTTFGYTLAAQVPIDPVLLGGNPQRTQIIHVSQNGIGQNQNFNRTFRYKIPPQFQRIKEDMKWQFTWRNNASVNAQTQVIYKLYQ